MSVSGECVAGELTYSGQLRLTKCGLLKKEEVVKESQESSAFQRHDQVLQRDIA